MSSWCLDSEAILVVVIYDSLDYIKKNEPKHSIVRYNLQGALKKTAKGKQEQNE